MKVTRNRPSPRDVAHAQGSAQIQVAAQHAATAAARRAIATNLDSALPADAIRLCQSTHQTTSPA
jgi:hypothetical protein